MTGDEGLAIVIAAAGRTIEHRWGAGSQYLRTVDGAVAGVAEIRYDLHRRRMSLRQRFRVEDDARDADTTGWVDAVIEGRSLYLLDDGWSRVRGAGLSASPVAVLFWLGGVAAVLASEPSSVRPGWSRHRALVDLARAVASADDPLELADGLREAGLPGDGEIEVEVEVDETGAVRGTSYGLDGDGDPVRVDLALERLGDPQEIVVPQDAIETDAASFASALLDPEV